MAVSFSTSNTSGVKRSPSFRWSASASDAFRTLPAVTLRAVADEVGVSHNAPYRHFSGRNALLGAAAERDFTMLRQRFDDQGSADRHLEAALRGGAAALIDYAMEH